MTLFDCDTHSVGKVRAVGCDREAHRRLVDLGLLDVDYAVRAKRKSSTLADFGNQFSAAVSSSVARQIEVIEKKI